MSVYSILSIIYNKLGVKIYKNISNALAALACGSSRLVNMS